MANTIVGTVLLTAAAIALVSGGSWILVIILAALGIFSFATLLGNKYAETHQNAGSAFGILVMAGILGFLLWLILTHD